MALWNGSEHRVDENPAERGKKADQMDVPRWAHEWWTCGIWH